MQSTAAEKPQAHASPAPAEGRAARLSYQPGLDGVRALAVAAVLIYHAEYSWMPGGFLGVEIFFVISGYLITSLLLEEWRQSGTINLPAFWLRRARRLLPALFLLLITVLTFAVLFLPDEVAGLRSDALAAATYSTNWYFIASQQSYFEAVGRPSLLKHLWSLAIEEQFYVLWPILLVLMLRRWQPRWVTLIVVTGAVMSSYLMARLFQPDVDPSRVYYGTDTRAAGLLLGSALAFLWAPRHTPTWSAKLPPDIIGLSALGALLLLCLRTNQFAPALYRGGFTVLGLATAVLIAITVHPQSKFIPRALAWRPLVWIGLRSYGIYLWHWPIYMLTRPQLDVNLEGIPLLAVRLVLTFTLAALSYRFVEMPIRTGALSRAWQSLQQTQGPQRRQLVMQWAVAAGTLTFFLMALGSTVVRAEPPAPPDYLTVASVDTIGSVATPPSQELDVAPSAIATLTATDSTQSTISPSATATPSPTEKTIAPSTTPTHTATPSTTPDTPGLHGQTTFPISPLATPTTLPIIAATPTPTQTLSPAASPTTTPTPTATCVATDGPVTAIGESVMIGAADAMQKAICNIQIDAVQGRLVPSAIEDLRAYAAAGKLGSTVVIHIGNNGVFTAAQFEDIMSILGPTRRVVFINIRVPREWTEPNNAVIAAGVKRYANAVLIDWYTLTARRPGLFWSDGMHLRPEGARYYTQLIVAAIKSPHLPAAPRE